jgi:hypothetical protein
MPFDMRRLISMALAGVLVAGAPAGDRIQRDHHISAKYTPFASPMAIATFQPIADLLAREGVARHGTTWTFDMGAYLRPAGRKPRWDRRKNNTAYPVRKNILVSTTDPRSSDSAAMYLAIASYVANGDTIVRGDAADKKILMYPSPTVQSTYTLVPLDAKGAIPCLDRCLAVAGRRARSTPARR